MYQVSNLMCYHGLYWHINVQQQCNMITVIVTMLKKKSQFCEYLHVKM